MFKNDTGRRVRLRGRAPGFVVLVAGLACAIGARGQTLMPELSFRGGARLLQPDLAALESPKSTNEFPCVVVPSKPELGLDFMFHTGYEIQIPFHELAGDGNTLTVVYRVIPQDHPNGSAYMVQKIPVPPIEWDRQGVVKIPGKFDIGEGKYHVDWLMRDQDERVCVASWNLETHLNPKDSRFRPWVPQALAQPRAPLFEEGVPVSHERRSDSLNIAIIARIDPRDPASPQVDIRDLESIVATLRQIVRDPRVATSSLVIFSSAAEQIVYQQEDLEQLDLPAFGEALKSLKLGIVDARRISSRVGPAEFTTGVIEEQMQKQPRDAVIVLSHKVPWESGKPHEIAVPPAGAERPLFHLTYDSGKDLWTRDPISNIVKRLRGVEYTIKNPRDLFDAWSDVVSRILRAKSVPQVGPPRASGGL